VESHGDRCRLRGLATKLALQRARDAGEPAGQLAARELEVQRIESAVRRAEELSADAAAALEAVA
jgi:hypothetical protein